jgi:hypothetical protein
MAGMIANTIVVLTGLPRECCRDFQICGWIVIAVYAIICIVHRDQKSYDSIAMNRTQQATLNAIYYRPTKADIRWSAIERLIRALGGEVTERAGSRVAARLHGVAAVFHRPHPRPETKKGAVDAVRQFLINAGVKP